MMAILNSARLPIVERLTDWKNCVEPRLRKSARSEKTKKCTSSSGGSVSAVLLKVPLGKLKCIEQKLFEVRQ